MVHFNEPNVAAIFHIQVSNLLLSGMSSLATPSTPYGSAVLMYQKAPGIHSITKASIINDHSLNFT